MEIAAMILLVRNPRSSWWNMPRRLEVGSTVQPGKVGQLDREGHRDGCPTGKARDV